MKEDLYKTLLTSILNKEPYSGLGYPSIIEEICKNNNLIFDLNEDYNGWECDWWATIKTQSEDTYCEVDGSMYYGIVTLSF